MAFLNIFGADFFNIQDKDTPNVPTTSSSSGSSFTPVASSSRNSSYTLPSPAVPTRPTSHQSLPALHIPLHMTPSFHHTSSSSLCTPDSGYYSAFLNSPGSHFFSAMSPLSPLDTRSGYAFQPALPAIIATAVQTNIDGYMDDADDEAHNNHPHIHGPLRLLQLYRAGKITAEVAENNCWPIECNVTGDFPCGFCGETGRSECAVFVKVASKSTSVETNCRLKGPINQLTAGKASARQPAQWRYNMEAHLAAAHPEYASPHNPDGVKRLPITVLESFELQRVEQLALGIPANKIPPKFIKVAGPDEGADLQPQQLGVRYKAPVRTTRIATIPVAGPSSRTAAAPVAGPSSRPKKKRKGNGGESLPP
ncbi:hypothetical protein DFH09DRAFT_1337840 [Mycena vulgaris]|nr:hypothetical protein DFH09DRAFT_1337840 [Mycena vulgaris]